jgi:hypothetical protein
VKRGTALRGSVAAGVLIGLTVLTACGRTTNGAQAPATQPITTVTTTAQPTTTVSVPPPTTVTKPTITTPKAPQPVVAKFVPAEIYAATCEITKPAAPKEIYVSCDPVLELRRATWSTWNRVHAEGTGQLEVQDCVPDCAQGKYTGYPVSIHFDTPAQTKCGAIWERAVFTFVGKPPSGADLKYPNGKPALVFTTPPTTVVGC